jgi:HPt (histidine-containing phosphotransfer) domain-containing protein
MPRAKTEAAAYLDIYKLVTERKRLEQELEALDQRRDRILRRLEILSHQTATLEQAAHQFREATSAATLPALTQPSSLSESHFRTIYLEY